MTKPNHRKTLIAAALAIVIATACRTPSPAASTPDRPDVTALPTLTPTPVLSPTPDVPPGWVTYRSEALRLSLYHPEDWEPVPYDDHKLDLREKAAQGWIEIEILDQTSADRWGLDYIPGMAADAILGELLGAAREDGSFENPRQIENRSGVAVWASQGHYDVLDDLVIIAVIGLDDRGIIVVGHGGADQVEWERLKPTYEQMVWSITPQG